MSYILRELILFGLSTKLNLASAEVGGGPEFVPHLIKYYLHALVVNEISLKGRRVLEDIEKVKELTSLRSTTDIVKSVILKINDDILQKKSKRPIKALEGIAAACQ